ncbi:glutamate decarboxylase 1-like [Haliotis rubra]|uniref:glutamate decarboxylase 1-like n=1 Tax=Haliotis rubra TaxID=36100 RepID=UPI001EE60289|nr:glutamate decarboxylase 1-like [Haliotis rubra]
MAFDCGVFQKLKRARSVQEPKHLEGNTMTTANDDVTKSMASELTFRPPMTSENRVSKFCRSPDWSEFEGMFATDFLKSGGSEKMCRFLHEIADVLQQYLVKQKDRGGKVLDFHHPHQLREMMAHCLDIHESPRDLEQILSDCKETLKYCVKSGHPRFLNQLGTGVDVIGVAGEWLAATANSNMFTYEVAPVFTLMEEIILQRMRSLVGWEEGDGIFAPGGAVSNFYGVLMARHRTYPDVKKDGMVGITQPVLFVSEQSHYSLRRAAGLLGIGTNNVISVKCDQRGKMIIEDLEKKINLAKQDGKRPMLVNATCGTTVFGAYDPVEAIADICEKYEMWLHIDAAWGGSALLSRKHRHLLQGAHRADSLTWNPHKMMGVPLQCSAILTKHKGLLLAANQSNAAYLFQKDKLYDVSYDTGDKTVQCGRHNDIFKLWLMWRSKGDEGFEDQMDRNFELAKYLLGKVKDREGFHLILDEIEGPNVCFWYIPQKWRSLKREEIPDEDLHKVAPAIKARMMESGTVMVQYQPLNTMPNFFRVAISNMAVSTRDLDFLLDEIECLGRDLNL